MFAAAVAIGALGSFCTPEQRCWPAAAAWDGLNATIGGNLIHVGQAAPNCTGSDAYPYAADPACMMTINDAFVDARLNNLPASSEYAVQVRDPAHVQAAITFANEHSIRIAVKTSGHDYAGRSASRGSLLIWLHGYNKVEVHDTFSDACNNESPAVVVQGGTVWRDVYPKISPKYHVVGGNALTVSAAGGYTQGGGQSVMSPSYGLAAENVISMEVVTADGKLVTASKCQNEDLFWALRGGGGGTFGVVVSMAHRLHLAPPEVTGFSMAVPLNPGVSCCPLPW
eukprot:Hpha_TRINITY_DN1247_c0_g1::TRINITY_DN1247_c0_g1_i1::g.44798::m.44798